MNSVAMTCFWATQDMERGIGRPSGRLDSTNALCSASNSKESEALAARAGSTPQTRHRWQPEGISLRFHLEIHRHSKTFKRTRLHCFPKKTLYIRYPTRHTAGSIEFGQRTTAGAGHFGAVVEFFLLIRPLIRPSRGGSCEMSAARAPSHALKIFFSNRFCYAQIVNMEGRVVASASSRPRPTSAQPGDPAAASSAATSTSDKVAAAGVGSEVAKKALEKGVDVVRWARGRQRYHGKVAALITAMQGDGVALR